MSVTGGLAEIGAQLQEFVVARMEPEARPRVAGLSRVGTGRSRENWLFDLEWTGDDGVCREPLIVRRDPPGGLLETERSAEFAVLRALESTAVPSPPVRWLDADGSELGKPSLVMTRLPGTCDYYLINGERPLAARVDLAGRFADLLADVHLVDTAHRSGAFGADPGPEAARFELRRWQAIVAADALQPWPELTVAGRWLERHAPTSPRTVLVHGDFKPGNILLDGDDRITALLDWELAHLGDPHEDLGWVTQPLRAGEHLIPGSWEAEDLFRRYERRTGVTVDREAVAWWNVFASFKTAAMQISGLRSFVEGRSEEPYQPSAPVLRELLEAAAR